VAQADEVDNSYLQVIFLKCVTVLLGQLKLHLPVDFDYGIHLTEYVLFQALLSQKLSGKLNSTSAYMFEEIRNILK